MMGSIRQTTTEMESEIRDALPHRINRVCSFNELFTKCLNSDLGPSTGGYFASANEFMHCVFVAAAQNRLNPKWKNAQLVA